MCKYVFFKVVTRGYGTLEGPLPNRQVGTLRPNPGTLQGTPCFEMGKDRDDERNSNFNTKYRYRLKNGTLEEKERRGAWGVAVQPKISSGLFRLKMSLETT
jgi:hypothetical protein